MSNHSAIAKDSESSSRIVISSHGNVSGGSVQLLSSFVLAQFFDLFPPGKYRLLKLGPLC